jgi:O-antigen ligase
MTSMTVAPPHRWRSLPLGIALSPLASLFAAGHAMVKRPSIVVAAALLIVCVPSPWQDLGASATVADAVAGLAVAAVAIRLVAGDRIHSRRGWIPYAAVIVALTCATFGAQDISEGIRGFVRYAELFVLVPVAVAMSLKDRIDVILVAGAMILTTVVEGVVGVYQSVTGTGASYAGQYVRAVGTFGAEQVLAMGAVIGYGTVVTLALALAFRGRAVGGRSTPGAPRSGRPGPLCRLRVHLVGLTVALGLPLALSLSRGAWIATSLAVVVMLIAWNWKVAVMCGALLVMVLGGLTLSGNSTSATYTERVTSIGSSSSAPDRSVQDRYALWGAAVGMWRDHPVFGVGLKDFHRYRDTYAPMSLSAGSDVDDLTAGFRREPLLSAHNQYLMVLSEQGVVGAASFGGLLLALGASAVRRRRPDEESTVESRFLDLVAPGLLMWTLVDFSYGDIGAGPTGVVLAVSFGLIARRGLIVPWEGVAS